MDPFEGKYPAASPYNFVLNSPLIAIDPDGKDVIIIIYGGHDNFKGAAITRALQAAPSLDPKKDHIYIIQVSDLGKLKAEIDDVVADAMKNGYGKTVEVDFYTHGGKDGPVGDVKASSGSLSDETGQEPDANQLSRATWQSIDFNFAKDKSVANFYGCNESDFAQNFLLLQPEVTYTSATDGRGSGSFDLDKYTRPNWLNRTIGVDDIYMVGFPGNSDNTEEIRPLVVYGRRDKPVDENLDIDELYDNRDDYTRFIRNNNLRANLYYRNGTLRGKTADDRGKEFDTRIDTTRVNEN